MHPPTHHHTMLRRTLLLIIVAITRGTDVVTRLLLSDDDDGISYLNRMAWALDADDETVDVGNGTRTLTRVSYEPDIWIVRQLTSREETIGLGRLVQAAWQEGTLSDRSQAHELPETTMLYRPKRADRGRDERLAHVDERLVALCNAVSQEQFELTHLEDGYFAM